MLEYDRIDIFEGIDMILTLIWMLGSNFTPLVGFPLITQKR